jgi:hypothetical protein
MDAAKFHETAKILLENITDNDLIEVDDQIRNISYCSTGFHGLKPPVRGCVVLWAQLHDSGNHAAKIEFTPELRAVLLRFANSKSNGGIRYRDGPPGGPKVDVVFMFEYEKDDHLPQISKSKDEHKDLLTVMNHRLLKQC